MDYLKDDLDSPRSSRESESLQLEPSPSGHIDSPDTSSSTSAATGQASMLVDPVIEDAEKSKWKPLVGTPTKDPIPENILVPDPSTPQAISDTDSSAQSTSSTSRSFIRSRRQGEHTSRPPAFPLPHTPKRAASLPLSKTGHDAKSRPYHPTFLNGKVPDVHNVDTGSHGPQRPPLPSAGQIPSFPDYSRERSDYYRQLDQLAQDLHRHPPMINSMRVIDPLAHFTGGLNQGPNKGENDPPTDFASGPSVNDQPGTSGSSVNDPTGSSKPVNALRGLDDLQKGAQPPQRVAPEPPRTGRTDISTSKPTTANSAHSANHGQKDSETSGAESDHTAHSGNPSGGCISKCSTTGARSYAHIETPSPDHADAEEMNLYLDLRCKPPGPDSPDWNRHMSIGSQIAFVGSTRWSNDKGEGVYDVGIPYGTQWYVARIFNDCWALCLKLELGLEPYEGDQPYRLLERFRRRKAPKIVERNGKQFIALKNHPVGAIYAPLCAFTLAANYGPFEERRQAAGTRIKGLATWEGGMIQAANRGASSVFEEEAKTAWKVYVPLQVWEQYKSFCVLSQQTVNTVDESARQENAPSEGALVSEDLSGRSQEKVSTGRQLQSLMSKSGTMKAIKRTANRVKAVFNPEPAGVDMPSKKTDTTPKAPYPISGISSVLEPERSNIIPPIPTQPPLRPFDDDQDPEFSRPLALKSPNLLSTPDLPLLKAPDNDDACQSSGDGNKQSEAASTGQPLSSDSSGGEPNQGDPHPGTQVTALGGLHPGIDFVPIGTFSQAHGYRVIPVVEPPERQGDVIVPVINPPENPDTGEVCERAASPSVSLPLRLKNAIQGKVKKVPREGTTQDVATLCKRSFSARNSESRLLTGRSRERNTLQNSLANAWKRMQFGRRRQSIEAGDAVPPGQNRRHSTFQLSVSNTWGSVRSGRRTPVQSFQVRRRYEPSLPEDVEPQGENSLRNRIPNFVSDVLNRIRPNRRHSLTTPEVTTDEATRGRAVESREIIQHDGDESNQPREFDYRNRTTMSLPIERLCDIPELSPPSSKSSPEDPNSPPTPRLLPVPGGLRDHLRRIAPHARVEDYSSSPESDPL